MNGFPKHRIALALAGGNALGAWQAGAFETLAARGHRPDRVSGASIGAVNGVIIAGNPPERAVERLRELWSPAAGPWSWWPAGWDEWRRTAAVTAAVTTGRLDLFVPRALTPSGWFPNGDEELGLFDSRPMLATLERLVDWPRLNDGTTRVSLSAVELDSGEDAVFDTKDMALGPEHVRASAALMPVFPPVEIDGRAFVDPGLSANLPLDAVLGDPGPAPLLVIALDLLPLASPHPRSMGEAIGRAQDIVFAAQTRRTIDAWKTVYDLHGADAPSVTLARLSYSDQGREVAGKAFDFSPETAADRWASGAAAMTAFLDELESGRIPLGEPGLTVFRDVEESKLAVGTFRFRAAGKAG